MTSRPSALAAIGRRCHQAYAYLAGYFWEPCPNCGRMFAGHEVRRIFGHEPSIATADTDGNSVGRCICPHCTNAGVGCRSHAAHGEYHPACEYAPMPYGRR